MEVTCLLKAGMYPDYAIVQAVRNSLQKDTRDVLLTLKPTSTTSEIVEKLTEIYGDIKSEDTIAQEFYAAKQKSGESVSAWGVRLETLFQKAVDRGELDESRRDKKLKERFWRGLKSESLKMATRVSYESVGSFEVLRRKARQEEEEYDEVEEKANVNVHRDTEKVLDEKLSVLQELLDRMKTVEYDIK